MKLWEAIKALEEGKKVRAVYWSESLYVYKDLYGNYITEEGISLFDSSLLNKDAEWELYDDREPVEKLVKNLYNIVCELQNDFYSYDEYLDTIDAEEHDDIDYVTRLYCQLQHMNKTYKLDK